MSNRELQRFNYEAEANRLSFDRGFTKCGYWPVDVYNRIRAWFMFPITRNEFAARSEEIERTSWMRPHMLIAWEKHRLSIARARGRLIYRD